MSGWKVSPTHSRFQFERSTVHAVAVGAESMIDEELIGFDAREAGEYDPRWDNTRRQRFLLRPEVARPLSLDLDVWPTIFDIGSLETTSRFPPGTSPRGAPLWDNLGLMRGNLDEQGADPADMVLVAVGWLPLAGFRDPAVVSPYPPGVGGPYLLEPAEPEQPEKSWDLLGYDVADGGWFSGLSNCGYTLEDTDRLREMWGPKLNEHHLFRDHRAAFAFVEVTNARVPEHAPFHVYSLYRLQ
jgi:hypothetical protein